MLIEIFNGVVKQIKHLAQQPIVFSIKLHRTSSKNCFVTKQEAKLAQHFIKHFILQIFGEMFDLFGQGLRFLRTTFLLPSTTLVGCFSETDTHIKRGT